VTESDLLGRLVEGRATLDSAVAEVMFRNVHTVHADDSAATLLELFTTGHVGLVLDGRTARCRGSSRRWTSWIT
jgi:predicted transcriptional regulator